MPTFEHEGLNAHYAESGAGDPLMLLHAGGSSGRQWRKAGSHLEADYRLIAPDFICFGETDPWAGPGDLSHDDQAKLVLALIGRLCDGAVHVIGHSYGGATAIRLWLAAPERVRSFVFIEPILPSLLREAGEDALYGEYRAVAEGFMNNAAEGCDAEAWRGFLDARNGAGTWDKLSDETRQRFVAGTRQTVDGFISNLNNATTQEECRSIKVPTSILRGADTSAPERRMTEILHDALPASAYEIIPDAGHMSPLTHPAEVAQLIRQHMARAAA